MKTFFSPSTKGFYTDAIHKEMPADAVEIDAKMHESMMDAQRSGFSVEAGADGRPRSALRKISTEEWKRVLSSGVQRHLNEQAAKLGYASIESAISYAEEPSVPQFQVEGAALRAWRSRVWERAIQLMSSEPLPSLAALLKGLPQLDLKL